MQHCGRNTASELRLCFRPGFNSLLSYVMKKTDTDIQDIYRSEDPKPEADRAWKTPELIEREIRKRLFFNITVALLIFALVVFLTAALIKDFLFAAEPGPSAKADPAFFSTYTLPADEQWALEYRQAASQTDLSKQAGPKPVSSKWIINAAYHVIMGEQASRMNELSAAQDHLEAVVAAFPAMTGIHHRLGTVYLKRQYFEKAVEQLQKALEEQPSVELLNNLGVAYMGIQDYGRAEAFLRQALQQRPDLAGCYKNLALLYQKTERIDDAVASFEKYFALNPQDTALIQSYVTYLTAAGRIRAAIEFIERLKGADPLPVSLLLAKTAAQDGDAELAIRALQEAARFITPRQTIAEMHDAAFDKIARTEAFEALLYRLELASVSLSTNLDTKAESGH
jgi:tetratricopeptide (TPR) repeat protein